MDTPEMRAGVTCYLGVNVEGAMFSLGDGHARQGEGETCGVAVECAMDTTVVARPRARAPHRLAAAGERRLHHDHGLGPAAGGRLPDRPPADGRCGSPSSPGRRSSTPTSSSRRPRSPRSPTSSTPTTRSCARCPRTYLPGAVAMDGHARPDCAQGRAPRGAGRAAFEVDLALAPADVRGRAIDRAACGGCAGVGGRRRRRRPPHRLRAHGRRRDRRPGAGARQGLHRGRPPDRHARARPRSSPPAATWPA